MTLSGYLLTAEGIGRSFGQLDALKSASLWAEAGKVTTLMGRNGSGKTTLMRIAAGDLRPDHGSLSFLGERSARHSLPALARRGLMYVPQRGLLSPAWTVREHFAVFSNAFDLPDPSPSIELLRVGDRMDHSAAALSGGEKSRVTFALIHARQPRILVADEPLVGLAPQDQELVADVLRQLARGGCAIVTSGHDARPLMAVSDVILWSVAGTTHHIGSPEEALKHAQFCREYLGPGW